MKTKFTPGPWTTRVTEINGAQRVWKETEVSGLQVKYDVCHVQRASKGTEFGGSEQMEANAALIAAAPEMYEALETWDNLIAESGRDDFNFDHLRSALNMARKVLSKARGES